jgi:hypothetical protein
VVKTQDLEFSDVVFNVKAEKKEQDLASFDLS